MITQNQINSISDLRFKTKEVLKKTSKGPVFLFYRNKPKGVLVSFKNYQEILSQLEDYFDSLKAEKYEKENKKSISWVSFSKIKKMRHD